MKIDISAAQIQFEQNTELECIFVTFRDGVGDGQLKAVKEYELAQLKQACTSVSEDYKPPFTFVVVQKRVNARFYVSKGAPGSPVDNPLPGTILDHTVNAFISFHFKSIRRILHHTIVIGFRSHDADSTIFIWFHKAFAKEQSLQLIALSSKTETVTSPT